MASYLKPIIDQVKTTFVASLNTKKDLIDSTVEDVQDDFILPFIQSSMPPGFPLIEIFPFGGSPVDSEEMNVLATFNFIVATRITVTGGTELAAMELLDIYMTAMTQSLISGVSASWHLDGVADVIRLISWDFPAEGESGETIYKQGALIWEMERQINPTA